MMAYRSPLDTPERNETPAQRLDRNWSELLQGLRVAQTGMQILSAFLLMLPFQARFTQLPATLVGFFVAAMILGTLSTMLIVAPAMAHRMLFRRHAMDSLVRFGNVTAIAGMLCMAVTVSLSLVVVAGFVIDLRTGLFVGAATLALGLGLWIALPLAVAGARQHGEPSTADSPDRPPSAS